MTDENREGAPPAKPPYRKTPPATPAVQAWLDGEVARDGLETADEQETAEFWARINREAEALRQRHTPIHVQSRILSSLPPTPVVTDEPSKGLGVVATVIGGLALLGVGAIIGFFLFS